ncbi:MAG: lysine-sensitive aspartokinase 3 [Gemmatimonadales bacterium]
MIVSKFGGTSVGDAAAIGRVVAIIRGRRARKPVVVVSALAGVTNALIEIGERSGAGQLLIAIRQIEGLRARHLSVAAEVLGKGAEADELAAEISASFDELAQLAEALSVLGHVTPRCMDAIASMGERVSAPLLAGAMRCCGLKAAFVDARSVMCTDDAFGRAEPQPERIAQAVREHVLPLVKAGIVPVLAGYIGSTKTGVTTTIGRGGGDYSASLIGTALEAEAIEIWTDVDGMLTADPRVVKGARLIEEIRFDEASELATFGAKVLHPSTIAPAVRKGIPVSIHNTQRPEGRGTRITFDAPRMAVRAVAGKHGVAVVRVRSPRMLGTPGFMQRILAVFDATKTSVDVIATSEVSVSMTVDDVSQLDAIIAQLSQLGDVTVERGRGIVALVGAGLGESTPTMARALGALGDLRLHMCSLSATGINLTLITDDDQVDEATRRLHAAFFEAAA